MLIGVLQRNESLEMKLSHDEPYKVQPDSAKLDPLLKLIQTAFSYMDGRISPPSSMHRLTIESIKEQCVKGEVWAIGVEPSACVFLKERENCFYLGKLAVDEKYRGQGLARRLVEKAEERGRARGHRILELETRIELVENHAAFQRMGFEKSGEGAHEGFDQPTWFAMRKSI